MKVRGITLKTAWARPENFYARSMFLFKKSLRETFFAPMKWFAFCQTSMRDMSFYSLDQSHIRFQELRRSSPCGNSFQHGFRENDRVMISYTSDLVLTTRK